MTIRMDKSSDQGAHSKKGKASRWFSGILNVLKFKRTKRILEDESSSEDSTDSSSEENITFYDVVQQSSSISISSEDNSMIKVSHSPNPITKNVLDQPSTSSCSELNSSSVTRRTITHQDPSAKYKPNTSNDANRPRRDSSRLKSFNHSPKLCFQPICQSKPRTNVSYLGKAFRSPLGPKPESNSRADDVPDGLMVPEKSDSWSLAHGDVSPKTLEDSPKCTKEELYAPLKYVRMEVKGDQKVPQRDETKPKRPQTRFGVLAVEKSSEQPPNKSANKKSTEMDRDRELEKLFATSLRTVDILTKIMVDILTLKSDST